MTSGCSGIRSLRGKCDVPREIASTTPSRREGMISHNSKDGRSIGNAFVFRLVLEQFKFTSTRSVLRQEVRDKRAGWRVHFLRTHATEPLKRSLFHRLCLSDPSIHVFESASLLSRLAVSPSHRHERNSKSGVYVFDIRGGVRTRDGRGHAPVQPTNLRSLPA